jgi:hypothetical protein
MSRLEDPSSLKLDAQLRAVERLNLGDLEMATLLVDVEDEIEEIRGLLRWRGSGHPAAQPERDRAFRIHLAGCGGPRMKPASGGWAVPSRGHASSIVIGRE